MKRDAKPAPAPDCIEDVTARNIDTIRDLEAMAESRRSLTDRIAAFIARVCGSMNFVWIHAALFSAWVAFNTLPGAFASSRRMRAATAGPCRSASGQSLNWASTSARS